MQELEVVREKIQNKYRVVKTDEDLEWNRAIDLCTNIINVHLSCENAAEIKRSSRDNDGWIPVEERLPTMEEYQKDDGRFILDDGNRRCAGYYDVYTGRFYSYRHITPYRAELYEDNRIIAWRPLPERYHPEPETEKPD